jgi:uncharacterized protein
MSQDATVHCTATERPSLHIFPADDSTGAVLFRIDRMEQVICSSRGAELARAALADARKAEALPAEIRDFLTGEEATASFGSDQPGGPDYSQTLYLMPTLECQLQCSYCRITREQGRQVGQRLSPERACAAIDRVFSQPTRGARRTVVFFGGEPLLARDTVFAAVAHVRSGPERDRTNLVIQTNAIALDAETAHFLAKHDVFVLLSLDTTQQVHDRHRVFADGTGSYEASVAGYRRARAAGCRLGVSATLTQDTADVFSSAFRQMLEELGPDECGVGTHLHPLTTGRSPHQASPAEAARVLTETFVEARRRGIYHVQMCQRLGPVATGTWRRYACAGCSGKVVVAPNGEAGICEYNAGNGRSYVPLEEFSPETVADMMRWASRSPLGAPECVRCSALPTCGGGCAYDSQEIMGDALKFDPWLCDTNVRVVAWAMHDLLSQLQPQLRDRDFHLVTPAERALLLGRIDLVRFRTPTPAAPGRDEG